MIGGTLYSRAAEALRTRITDGVWRQGDRLPAETQLCQELGVSSITMRRAIATLVAEGLLVRIQGKGTYVASDHAVVMGPPRLTSFTQDMQLRGWRAAARLLGMETEHASLAVAQRLGIPEGALVTRIRRVRLADDDPVAIQVATVPALLFPGLDRFDFARESLYAVMQREYGIKPAVATEVYRASLASAEEAALLEVEVSSPVLRCERLTSDSTGKRVEVVESVMRGDRYTLSLRLTASGR
ncbi:MAG TPA: GntR family transcriptional regulator [Candidatus Dormibacteraeota bacterium]|nr:GntR family transcriptional regulator [Candidatus Dormibacteraeota bacterium]